MLRLLVDSRSCSRRESVDAKAFASVTKQYKQHNLFSAEWLSHAEARTVCISEVIRCAALRLLVFVVIQAT